MKVAISVACLFNPQNIVGLSDVDKDFNFYVKDIKCKFNMFLCDVKSQKRVRIVHNYKDIFNYVILWT